MTNDKIFMINHPWKFYCNIIQTERGEYIWSSCSGKTDWSVVESANTYCSVSQCVQLITAPLETNDPCSHCGHWSWSSWSLRHHQTILTMQHHAVVWTLQWSWLLITFILIIISFCSNNHCSSVLCWEGQPSTRHHLSSSTVLNILTFDQLDKQ